MHIHAIVNVPFDSLSSINWSSLINPNCPDCLTQPVAPIITTTYSVVVTSHNGCSDEDAMTLFVDQRDDIYVPNVFSPNGDNINDRLLISAGEDVDNISSFIIYDRWGEMVLSANDFSSNDPLYAWDEKLKGRFLNPGVFAYR
ncbi:MAG: gliding motility-associated C-terminal domain-containing protein [Saprospiraceae bacterium]